MRLIIASTFATLLILSFLFGFTSYRNQNFIYTLIHNIYYFFELNKPKHNKKDYQEIKILLNDKEFIDYQILYAREIYDFVKKDPLSFRKEILKKAILPKEIVTIKKEELKKNYEFQNLIPKDVFKSLDNKFLINVKYYGINHFGILEKENNNKLFIFNGGQGPSRTPLQYEKFLNSKYSTIEDSSEDDLKNTHNPEHPHQATFQNYLMTLDPDLGYVPSNRLNEAFINKNSINTSFRNREMIWDNIQSNMGGRTRAAMFDPNDSEFNKLWAGSVSGGLWYNNDITDQNSSWISVSDFWDNLSVSKITHDPENTNIFYVGTGEANTAITTYRESSSKGIGIWKTINAGESFHTFSYG